MRQWAVDVMTEYVARALKGREERLLYSNIR